ncbi:MAG: hypothetical protein QM786_19485 [Breznakibacter sp.]
MPPAALTVAVPAVDSLVCAVAVSDKGAVGWPMVTFTCVWQRLASVTVQVYVPAASPEAVAPVPPAGDQA